MCGVSRAVWIRFEQHRAALGRIVPLDLQRLAVVCALLIAPVAGAMQSKSDVPLPRQKRTAATDQPEHKVDARRIRARLSSMLEGLQSTEANIQKAIDILDEGGSERQAIAALGGPRNVRRLSAIYQFSTQPEKTPDRAGRDFPGRNPERMQRENRQNQLRDPLPMANDRRPPGANPPDMPGLDRQADITFSPEEIFAYLDKYAPVLSRRIGELRANNPERARMIIQRFVPRALEIKRAMRTDPELGKIMEAEFQVSLQLMGVSDELRRARATHNEKMVAQAKEALRKLAAEDVDLRFKQRAYELQQLLARTEKLQKELDEHTANREQLIKRVLQHATRAFDQPKNTD